MYESLSQVDPITIYWAQIQTPYRPITEKKKSKSFNNTLTDSEIKPKIPCSAVTLTTTQPTRQSVRLS